MNQKRALLFEVLASEIDEELEKDMLEFINVESAIEEEDLFNYFQGISCEDILYWLEEYEAKWNPDCRIYEIVNDQINFYFSDQQLIIKKSLDYFNIPKENIPKFIKSLSNEVSPKRKYQIEKWYETVYDFIGVLYYFRFVEKLEKSEIAHIMGIQVNPLHIHLYNFCWHYSNNFDENTKEYEREKSKLQAVFKKAKTNALKLKESEHPMLIESLNRVKIKKNSYIKLGFRTKDDYIKTFYHLIFIDKLVPKELMVIFNLPYSTIQSRLRNLGFNINIKDAIVKKMENGNQDYEKSIRTGKITRLNSRYRHLSDSTINENYARELLDKYSYEYFDSNVYDFVVGVNNVGLLLQKEVDIPVIICNRRKNKWYKFAIEYNGPYHSKEKDFTKANIAEERGWIYIAIVEEKNSSASNNRKIIQGWVREVCMEMKRYIGDE
ncbi:hypothetical protein [Cytobacillus sp. SAFR-174]|uniref:hypothetical protein n=1 Tax=Cytobacillus sp. SAFR-174 TaxID=3436868 RepID=UPI003F7FE579